MFSLFLFVFMKNIWVFFVVILLIIIRKYCNVLKLNKFWLNPILIQCFIIFIFYFNKQNINTFCLKLSFLFLLKIYSYFCYMHDHDDILKIQILNWPCSYCFPGWTEAYCHLYYCENGILEGVLLFRFTFIRYIHMDNILKRKNKKTIRHTKIEMSLSLQIVQ